MAEVTSKNIIATAITVDNKKVCLKGQNLPSYSDDGSVIDRALMPLTKIMTPQAQSFCTTLGSHEEAAKFAADVLVNDIGIEKRDIKFVSEKGKKARAEIIGQEVTVRYHVDRPSINPIKALKLQAEEIRNAAAHEEKHDLVSVTNRKDKN